MKALSMHQPWASLMAMGAKQFETRSWSTVYRGPILIQAGKRWTEKQREICRQEPFSNYIKDPDALPHGQVICMVQVVKIISTDDALNECILDEESFGDYGPNRYAWLTENLLTFDPFPYRGRQGLFNIPDGDLPFCKKCKVVTEVGPSGYCVVCYPYHHATDDSKRFDEKHGNPGVKNQVDLQKEMQAEKVNK